MIEIAAYDVDDTLKITELGTIRDQAITDETNIDLCEDQVCLYEIQCADFNGDGIDEILLTGRINYVPGGWQLFANLYAYNESSGNLESLAKDTIFTQANSKFDIGNINSAAGHFYSPDRENAVISFFQTQNISRSDPDTIENLLIPIEVDTQLQNITAGDPIYQRKDTIPYECYYNRTSTLRPVDVNKDGIDELLYAFSFDELLPICHIYKGQPPLSFVEYADLGHIGDEFYGAVAIGDFYADSLEDQPPVELIVTHHQAWNQHFTEIYGIRTLPDGSFDSLELKHRYFTKYPPFPRGKTEPQLAGNFDRDIRIGIPKRYSITEILQPLVILNAPPIHFDIFDDQAYDICRSYNEYQSNFISRYAKETQQSTEVRTEVNQDWSLSKTISGGFSFWGVSVSSHLTEKYGKKFSKVQGSSRTVTVGFEIEALVDDQIYATVMDYDIWEYPVYGDHKLEGHLLVVDPKIVKNSWFDSKSWKGYSYIPNHEVGNILSYRHYPLLSDNPMLIEKIKGDYGLETSFLLSGNSSYNWFLNFTDFTENQATTTKEYSRDWGVSVSAWGSGFSMQGSYNREDIQTQRTTVESGIDLNVHLDAVDMGIGETRYEVTPYAYWASNGALVIDYAVAPELAQPGGEDTWWDTHYGYFPDPAFILPWRHDPEKGFKISEAKRYQTNDIVFKPENPADGDTITIYAQVHNFRLLPTPGPVGVRFYIGDPGAGGTLITGTDGASEVFTDGIIPSRGRTEVKLQWKIPAGLNAFPRIYAEIDGDDNLLEIHENNNKSWNILQKTTGIPIEYKPVITVSETLLNFGEVNIGEFLELPVRIYNTGREDLVIDSITSRYAVFTHDFNPENNSVMPGDSLLLMIKYMPDSSSEIWDTLNIVSNDTLVKVLLAGMGSGTSGITEHGSIIPVEYNLHHSYPNPFNTLTTITFDLPEISEVTILIYNSLGEQVINKAFGKLATGRYKFTWDASGIPEGVYIYRLKANDQNLFRKMILLRY